jgi:hypothetical protein
MYREQCQGQVPLHGVLLHATSFEVSVTNPVPVGIPDAGNTPLHCACMSKIIPNAAVDTVKMMIQIAFVTFT